MCIWMNESNEQPHETDKICTHSTIYLVAVVQMDRVVHGDMGGFVQNGFEKWWVDVCVFAGVNFVSGATNILHLLQQVQWIST